MRDSLGSQIHVYQPPHITALVVNSMKIPMRHKMWIMYDWRKYFTCTCAHTQTQQQQQRQRLRKFQFSQKWSTINVITHACNPMEPEHIIIKQTDNDVDENTLGFWLCFFFLSVVVCFNSYYFVVLFLSVIYQTVCFVCTIYSQSTTLFLAHLFFISRFRFIWTFVRNVKAWRMLTLLRSLLLCLAIDLVVAVRFQLT